MRFPALHRWNLDRVQTAILFGLLLLTLALYTRCLADGFVYDDNPTIVDNRYIAEFWPFVLKSLTHDLWWFQGPHQLPNSSFYRPLHSLWLAINFHFFGLNPAKWHLLKITLHLCAVLFSFRVAELLTGDADSALVAALLFGLLPVHAQAVVSIQAIGEPLAAVFELGALSLFIQRSRTAWRLGWSLILFAAAAFSHESAVVFPFLIFAYVWLMEPGEPHSSTDTSDSASHRVPRALVCSIPFLIVTALYLVTRAMVLGTRAILGIPNVRGIHEKVFEHSFGETVLSIPGVLLWYLETLALPWLSGPAHNMKFVTSLTSRGFYVPAATLLMLVLFAYLAFRNSSRRRLYLFCVIWWLISLAPALNLDHVVGLVHDRFQYLASFGFCLIVADCMIRIGRTGQLRSRITVTAVGVAVAALYMISLWQLEPIWRDNFSLFSRCVKASPASPYYRQALAATLIKRADFEGAARQLQDASKLAPEQNDIHYKLGMLYLVMQRGSDASRELGEYYQGVYGADQRSPAPKRDPASPTR